MNNDDIHDNDIHDDDINDDIDTFTGWIIVPGKSLWPGTKGSL